MATAKEKRRLGWWWKIVFMLILTGAGFAATVALKWDRLVELSGADAPEYSEKDLMQCEAGTHQEGSKCVANKPTQEAPAAPAASPAPASAVKAPAK